MRLRGIPFVALLLLLVATPARAQFEYVWGHPKPQGNSIFGLAFLDDTTGWAVGGAGMVLRTDDGAVSWQVQQAPGDVAADFYDAWVLSGGTLIAAGTGARVYRSVDGGVSWNAIANPSVGHLRDLAAYPGGLSAAGENGSVIVSTDDGATWTELGPQTGVIRHHVWLSATEGYVVGENVAHRTFDGGATWTQFIPFGPFGYNEVYFASALHGVVVEDFGTWETLDGGTTWTEHPQFGEPLYRYRTLQLDAQHWVTVTLFEGAEFWETTDAGATWTQFVEWPIAGFPSIARTPGGRIVMGSDTGDLVRTDDLGRTTHNATVNLCEAAPSAPMAYFVARPDGVLFAANQPSSSGQVQSWLRSDDGGHTWFAPTESPGIRWIDARDFHDEDHGIVTYRYFVRRTSDGGATWQHTDLATDVRTWQVAMPTPTKAFLATTRNGGGGDLLRSDDGGATWNPVGGGLPVGSTFEAGAVDFWNADEGAVFGRLSGQTRLYRTDDGGDGWSLTLPSGLPTMPNDVHWFDANVAVAAVGASAEPGVYRTGNGGATWSRVDPTRASQIAFRDDLHGAVVGPFGDSFLTTDDAGQTWTEEVPPLHGPAPGAQFSYVRAVWPTAEGWVLGASNNRILVAIDPDLITAANPPRPDATARLLSVTPNPFNPSTRIEFTLDRAGWAELVLFDTRGRRVRSLETGEFAGGTHQATWDGRDDLGRAVASGVYLVRLRTDGGSDEAKALLRK